MIGSQDTDIIKMNENNTINSLSNCKSNVEIATANGDVKSAVFNFEGFSESGFSQADSNHDSLLKVLKEDAKPIKIPVSQTVQNNIISHEIKETDICDNNSIDSYDVSKENLGNILVSKNNESVDLDIVNGLNSIESQSCKLVPNSIHNDMIKSGDIVNEHKKEDNEQGDKRVPSPLLDTESEEEETSAEEFGIIDEDFTEYSAYNSEVQDVLLQVPKSPDNNPNLSTRSNLKRKIEEDHTEGSTKKARRGIQFDGVTVFYFPRSQGFNCVPSQGGSTLGMSRKHFYIKKFSLNEHEAEQKRIHKEHIMQLRQQKEKKGNCSSSEDSEDASDVSDSEMEAEPFFFLQPLPIRQRRTLLRQSGIRQIEGLEKEECKDIRISREMCGCQCKLYCHPDTCQCAEAGIKCQVDRHNFPCGCTKDGCGNKNGRIEFNPIRVRTHFLHTLMRIEIEKRHAQLDTKEKCGPSWFMGSSCNNSFDITGTSPIPFFNTSQPVSNEISCSQVPESMCSPFDIRHIENESCSHAGHDSNVDNLFSAMSTKADAKVLNAMHSKPFETEMLQTKNHPEESTSRFQENLSTKSFHTNVMPLKNIDEDFMKCLQVQNSTSLTTIDTSEIIEKGSREDGEVNQHGNEPLKSDNTAISTSLEGAHKLEAKAISGKNIETLSEKTSVEGPIYFDESTCKTQSCGQFQCETSTFNLSATNSGSLNEKTEKSQQLGQYLLPDLSSNVCNDNVQTMNQEGGTHYSKNVQQTDKVQSESDCKISVSVDELPKTNQCINSDKRDLSPNQSVLAANEDDLENSPYVNETQISSKCNLIEKLHIANNTETINNEIKSDLANIESKDGLLSNGIRVEKSNNENNTLNIGIKDEFLKEGDDKLLNNENKVELSNNENMTELSYQNKVKLSDTSTEISTSEVKDSVIENIISTSNKTDVLLSKTAISEHNKEINKIKDNNCSNDQTPNLIDSKNEAINSVSSESTIN